MKNKCYYFRLKKFESNLKFIFKPQKSLILNKLLN